MTEEPLDNDDAEDSSATSEDKRWSQARGDRGKRPTQTRRQADSSGGPRGGVGRPYRFRPRRKVCAFCVDKVKDIDWKDVNQLRRFVTDSGSIRPRRKTGTCARHQRRLAVAVKRARHLALLPFTREHVRLAGKT